MKKKKSAMLHHLVIITIILGIIAVIIIAIQVFVPMREYREALGHIEHGRLSWASSILIKHEHYKDSQKIIADHALSILKDAQEGNIVYWGKYEQDNNLKNGTEIIEWQVIIRNDNRLLLLSDKFLDVLPYHTEMAAITWENCSLRNWLNNDFYHEAFTNDEKSFIDESEIINHDNTYGQNVVDGGNNTQDKVFLLSLAEIEEYQLSSKTRVGMNTAYTTRKGSRTKFYGNEWWLRSPGYESDYASIISDDGDIWDDGGPVFHGLAVRPVIWIDLNINQ